MSKASDICKNYGKYSGTSNYNICERCANGLINGCKYFEKKEIKMSKKEMVMLKIKWFFFQLFCRHKWEFNSFIGKYTCEKCGKICDKR